MLSTEEREYLTAEEAAARFKVSISTIRRMIAGGGIQYKAKRGRRLLVLASDVKAALAQRTTIQPIEEIDDGGAK